MVGFFSYASSFHSDATPSPVPVRPVWMKQDDVLPRFVGIERLLVHSDAVAVGVIGLWCYPNGFEFGVEVVLREPDRRGRLMSHMHYMLEPGDPLPPELLRVGMRFSDGTKVTNLPQSEPWPQAGPDRPIMLPGGRGGGDRTQSHQFWVWPLPPPGPMTLVCEWPHFHIEQTETIIDAQLVLDAAADIRPLWPIG